MYTTLLDNIPGLALGSLFFCPLIRPSRPFHIDPSPNQTYRDGRCIGLSLVLFWHSNTLRNGSLVGMFIPIFLFNSSEISAFQGCHSIGRSRHCFCYSFLCLKLRFTLLFLLRNVTHHPLFFRDLHTSTTDTSNHSLSPMRSN
jgi:hypothetical protein